ncbi:MAG: metallophosphoesterase [Burkholderiaceae bacterium]|nr:metallophosphoesterase [Burkholderiaceae bacterium]
MRTLVHLSDLHFGRVDHALVEPLVQHIITLAPDVVVVSGDLTQRARSDEFKQARAFLARLPGPQVVVPGNHDVPLYNFVDRFLRPLDKFRRFITHDLSPSHIDEEMAVLGVNTARSLVVKNGRISEGQLATLRSAMQDLPAEVVKVVVTHHPFDVAASVDEDNRVGRASLAMNVFAEQAVDVLLAGHLHMSHSAGTGSRYAMGGYEALVVSAGTATSTRGRGEANSFNVLRLDKQRVEVERMEWTAADNRFVTASNEVFERTKDGWRQVEGHVQPGAIL